MRRYLIVIVILLAACSGDGTATTERSLAETDSNVAGGEAATTTSEPAETTTTTTTSAAPTTVTEGPSFDEFPTLSGTPPDEFESFAATMTMSMQLGELALDVTAEGIWTEDAFNCTVSSGLGGITFSESIVATPEQLWVDSGNGYEPVDLFGTTAQDIMSSCPTSTLFWSNFTTEDFGYIDGEEETIGGRTAIRADLTELLDGLGGLGLLSGFEGATINEMTLWIDEETNTVLAMTTDMEMSGELMSEFGADDTGPVGIVMDFALSQINDPGLMVELP